mmetsp:Transcript_3199/g.4537  ORF Transcript_3199/g.4537 Transcript_3199/m.4537 type:complete len:252 (-) Transcript_3199:1870-2625(-)|eukprot:CAMPEP_0175093936 /NCGR_PEP_ID=MMETSP0086_2-20121207/3298_1 /TAXON_ID=136419 /ORGANISM="Unknown Unknown, Strain D1" /LENGTH=251 /DNA_ID=CAMNT_0016366971 /DNA_START=1366 /DNA_END=2121 /DNA_ORIENTATION=-
MPSTLLAELTEAKCEASFCLPSCITASSGTIVPKIGDLFTGPYVPDMEVEKYWNRLKRHFDLSPNLLEVVMIYLDRFVNLKRPEVTVNAYTVHRLVLVSYVVAAKYWEDEHHSNKFYSQVGGIDLSELNRLEMQMLGAFKFEMSIAPEDLQAYRRKVSAHTFAHARITNLASTATAASNGFSVKPKEESGINGRKRKRSVFEIDNNKKETETETDSDLFSAENNSKNLKKPNTAASLWVVEKQRQQIKRRF